MTYAERKADVEARHAKVLTLAHDAQIEAYKLEGEYRLLEALEAEAAVSPPIPYPQPPAALADPAPVFDDDPLRFPSEALEPLSPEEQEASDRLWATFAHTFPNLEPQAAHD